MVPGSIDIGAIAVFCYRNGLKRCCPIGLGVINSPLSFTILDYAYSREELSTNRETHLPWTGSVRKITHSIAISPRSFDSSIIMIPTSLYTEMKIYCRYISFISKLAPSPPHVASRRSKIRRNDSIGMHTHTHTFFATSSRREIHNNIPHGLCSRLRRSMPVK